MFYCYFVSIVYSSSDLACALVICLLKYLLTYYRILIGSYTWQVKLMQLLLCVSDDRKCTYTRLRCGKVECRDMLFMSGTGVTANCLHPGAVYTDLWRQNVQTGLCSCLQPLITFAMRSRHVWKQLSRRPITAMSRLDFCRRETMTCVCSCHKSKSSVETSGRIELAVGVASFHLSYTVVAVVVNA